MCVASRDSQSRDRSRDSHVIVSRIPVRRAVRASEAAATSGGRYELKRSSGNGSSTIDEERRGVMDEVREDVDQQLQQQQQQYLQVVDDAARLRPERPSSAWKSPHGRVPKFTFSDWEVSEIDLEREADPMPSGSDRGGHHPDRHPVATATSSDAINGCILTRPTKVPVKHALVPVGEDGRRHPQQSTEMRRASDGPTGSRPMVKQTIGRRASDGGIYYVDRGGSKELTRESKHAGQDAEVDKTTRDAEATQQRERALTDGIELARLRVVARFHKFNRTSSDVLREPPDASGGGSNRPRKLDPITGCTSAGVAPRRLSVHQHDEEIPLSLNDHNNQYRDLLPAKTGNASAPFRRKLVYRDG